MRRELLRLRKTTAVNGLDGFISNPADRLLRIGPSTLTVAADLWAQARQGGTPTADPHALDVDLILAAQVLTAGWNLATTVVATSNTKHVGLFVPAKEWADI